MSMNIDSFMELVKIAKEKEKEEKLHRQWTSMLPFMSLKQLEYISFKEYKERVTGANIDVRPTSVILKEIEEIHRKKVND